MVRVRSRVQSSLTAPFNTSNSGSYGEPASGRYDNLRAFAGTNADKSGLPRTNPVHAAPICSPDVPQTNENPAASGKANGANVDTKQVARKLYTDAHINASRVDLDGKWKLGRWDWKRAVRADRGLSDAGKVLAAALCDDFAHYETAFCNPSVQTLADALGKDPRSISRALAELRKAQWITIRVAVGRGKTSEISFLSGHGEAAMNASEKVKTMSSVGTESTTDMSPIRVETDQKNTTAVVGKHDSRVTPFLKKEKDKPNTRERPRGDPPVSQRPSGRPDYTAYDRATAPETWSGVLFTIKRGGNAEATWNDWLTCHGFPTLAEIGPGSGTDGWAVPCTLPPRPDGDRFEVSRAEKWARIFSRKAKGVANV